jgi:hypothetical protein
MKGGEHSGWRTPCHMHTLIWATEVTTTGGTAQHVRISCLRPLAWRDAACGMYLYLPNTLIHALVVAHDAPRRDAEANGAALGRLTCHRLADEPHDARVDATSHDEGVRGLHLQHISHLTARTQCSAVSEKRARHGERGRALCGPRGSTASSSPCWKASRGRRSPSTCAAHRAHTRHSEER